MSIACVALFAAFANGESLIPQGANVAPPTGRGAKFPILMSTQLGMFTNGGI